MRRSMILALRAAAVVSSASLFGTMGHCEGETAPTAQAPEARIAPTVVKPHVRQPKRSVPAPPHTANGGDKTGTAPKIAVDTKQPEKAAPAPATATPPMPAPETNPDSIGEFQPVLHARNAHIDTCMDNIVAQSGRVIDRPHKAASTWVTNAPNDHAFQSIVGLSYPNKQAPNGVAIIFASPLGPKRCEGESVQIYPTSQSCAALQVSLLNSGHTVGTLENIPMVEQTDGARNLLMPTAGAGCVLVSVRLR